MSAFADALAALFADSNLSKLATYNPVTGDNFSARVISIAPQQIIAGSGLYTEAILPAYQIDIMASDIAQPSEGDEVTVDGDTFKVRSFELDTEKLSWKLNVDKQ